ncbi:DUF2058 domain-containing protein [Neptunomonas marina]|uniref:DUF2058 domain-containing protein n=1 Tax=Neptunomonas marina TaxID=1815562 RepID=A0A437QCX8_9GAMM|nr:DUF2058 domain-containing protein [Neptunomonas marina]RVU32400.1 DUF2058 domain-containing protein [Neptunomonas marina]
MSKSLQDQLLKAGLASKKQANKAKADKRKAKKKAAPQANDQAAQEQARIEKQQRDKALNQQRNEERAKKDLESQAKQIIETSLLSLPKDAEVRYNFVHDKQVKSIYVTADIQYKLSRSLLAIAILEERYVVIPNDAAEKVLERKPEWVILIQKEEKHSEDDDYYAQFEVPDDLMW